MVRLAFVSWLLSSMATAADVSDEVTSRYEARTFDYTASSGEKRELKYRLLKPAHIAAGKKYPLVIFLHGAGERGDDNLAQLKYLPEWMAADDWQAKYPCYLIAPQCPSDRWWAPVRAARSDEAREKQRALDTQLDGVLGVIDAAVVEFPIDANRLYLTGLSMGGFGSWALASREPTRFAAVVPICGGGDPAWAETLRDIPIWVAHGGADRVVPPAKSREMVEALRTAGGQPKYTELDGVGHDSWTPTYKDPQGPLPWMFEQVKGR
ncbi:MAG: dienelactone hydrolase family protein [Pirellulales bacterium]|nr:dienelactone hydrolase family protein [Pirellulales bacterium]